ncbi:apoptosis inhibitory protein 5 [Actinidia rufa]|uniref:Apoptosis inhibitory protein 5 n=1 Tax=Actinidia rufa TaxID=165716 RepID=A0A7J0DJF4_9ERIC|nr:apoptosis inhibitory protein 5 [Actinidia rufa]
MGLITSLLGIGFNLFILNLPFYDDDGDGDYVDSFVVAADDVFSAELIENDGFVEFERADSVAAGRDGVGGGVRSEVVAEVPFVAEKSLKQNTATGLRTCNNILAMTQALHSKSPSFIGDTKINLSWKAAVNAPAPSTTVAAGVKRPVSAANGSNNNASKKGRGGGGFQNQLANRAFEGLSSGGRSGSRGRGRGYR